MVTYKEHIVKKKKTKKDVLIYILTPIACILLAYFIPSILINLIPFLSFLIPLVWVGAIYGAVMIIAGRNVEFEYLLVDSDLDIDRISNKSRRKRLISLYRKEIIAVAPIGSSNLPHNWKQMEKIDACESPEAPDTYVVAVRQSDKERAVLFSPTEEMLEIMDRRNPGKVFRD